MATIEEFEKKKHEAAFQATKLQLENSTYEVDFLCLNCQYKNKIRIPKGRTVRKNPCPFCDCKPEDVE